MHTALAYLLTAPVINPVVILATAMAFQWNWHIVGLRVFSTFIVGATTALLAGSLFSSRDFTNAEWHKHEHEHQNSKVSLHQLLTHAGDEFFDVGRYLIVSAFLAADIQIWVPKGILIQATSNPFMAALAMMVLAIAQLSFYANGTRSASADMLNKSTSKDKVNSIKTSTPKSANFVTKGSALMQLYINLDDHPEEVYNQHWRLSGFVYKDPKLAKNQFVISRFVITCCIVDATPIGIIVECPDTLKLKADTWVEVEGLLQKRVIGGSEKIKSVQNFQAPMQ